jgi:hypothetical protein
MNMFSFCDDFRDIMLGCPHVTKSVTDQGGQQMICAGCGQLLHVRRSRGRPARFHNAACRQRAHRARQASRHHDVLVAIAELEAATSELRRTVLTDADIDDAGRRLARASTVVHQLLPYSTKRNVAAVAGAYPPASADHADRILQMH